MQWITILQYAFLFVMVFVMIVALIRSRYRKFTSREFVLYFRNGKLKKQGFGGSAVILPFIDELIVLPTTIQALEVETSEVITRENQDVLVKGFVIWRIDDPSKAYQSIGNTKGDALGEINHILERLVESIVRTTVARLSLDQVLRERSLIIEAIMSELVPVVEPMGISVNTVEVRHVDVVDQNLFNDLQETYRQDARLVAEKTKIETEREVRITAAQQQEAANVRDLEKDRMVLLEQQKLNETEEKRLRAVQELQKNREAAVAELEKKRLQVEAETRLMEIELEAESKKRKMLLEEIDVKADGVRRAAKAEKEATELAAQAEAFRLEQVAEASKKSMITQAEGTKQAQIAEAEAEAFKIAQIGEAKRKALLAEAEGKKAILIAEAEGLREKVKAQGLVNDAMIMQELIQQLPAIASSMKVGDINWLNMGGQGSNGESPLGIIPKNLLHVMTLAKSFGLDLEGLIRSIRGKDPLPKEDDNDGELVEMELPEEELLENSPTP